MPIAIAVVRSGNEVLVGIRPAQVPLAGLAEFPGGKCAPGESPEQAAVRECLEETGLAVHASRRLCEVEHAYPYGRLRLIFVECQLPDRQPPRPPFFWVPVHQLHQLPFPEANRTVLDLLTSHSPRSPE
jgi:8-oxo-dGTP diphosphatase